MSLDFLCAIMSKRFQTYSSNDNFVPYLAVIGKLNQNEEKIWNIDVLEQY